MTNQAKVLLVLLLFAACCCVTSTAAAVNVKATCATKDIYLNNIYFNCTIEAAKNPDDEQGTSYVVTNVTIISHKQVSNVDIEKVIIKDNPLDVIPQGLSKFVPKLERLEVDNIKSLDKEDLTGITKLEGVDITASARTGVPSAFFKDNTKMSYSIFQGPFGLLSEDALSSVPKNASFADDKYRESFHCHDPSLTTGAESQLECDIYGIPPACFYGIEFLSMNGTDIPLSDIKKLRIFNSCRSLSPKFIQNFKNLEVLKVKGGFSYLNHYFMMKFPNLVELDLSDCKVESIEDDTFESNPKLRNVSLTNNEITKIGILTFESIDNVDLRDNACTNKRYDRESKQKLSKDLQSCDFGETLVCKFKVNSYEVVGDLYSCTSKTKYFSGYTKLYGVAGFHQVGKQNEDVTMLTINEGQYSAEFVELVSSKYFVNLRGLTLKSILTDRSFSFDWFKRMPKLDYLDLSFLKFKTDEISRDAFQSNPNLKYLNLENCGIQHIHVGVFKNLPNLELLNLKHNPLIDQQFNRNEIPSLIETLKLISVRCEFERFYECTFHDDYGSLNEANDEHQSHSS